MVWIISAIILILGVPQLIGYALSEDGYKGPVTDHFNGKRFYNYGADDRRNLWHLLKWMLNRNRGKWTQIESSPGPTPSRKVEGHLRVTHVNHSTFLIQCDRVNILTDPVWSDRVSPFEVFGPKRMRPPGLRLEDLPEIHIILLSHNHYDHLDLKTLNAIVTRHNPQFIVPLGVGALLKKNGIACVNELDWWQSITTKSLLEVQCLPAHHSTARGSVDRDKTLWCGFATNTSAGKIFFAGDTGYHSDTFKRIGKEAGPFKISIIPIGAYKPKWFMSPVHCDPAEALQIHLDVKSEVSIASHFGTFPLGDEGQDEPKNDLKHALHEIGVDPSKFVVPVGGQPIDFT
jgi:L-ascorbate metabolism protein UlaG (beta-lactamase superfamily)